MKTVGQLLHELVNHTGEYKVEDLVKFEGIMTGRGTPCKSIQFEVNGVGSLKVNTRPIGKTVEGFPLLLAEGKVGSKVQVEGTLLPSVGKEGQHKVFNIEAMSVAILELPVVERPIKLPLTANRHLKLVAGDVIRPFDSDDDITLSEAQAKRISDDLANGSDYISAYVVSFVDRVYGKNMGGISHAAMATSFSGKQYTEEDVRMCRHVIDVEEGGEVITTWRPCIDTLYRDYLKASMKQAQIKVDSAVKELAEFNKAYGEFVDYKEYQSKVLLRK